MTNKLTEFPLISAVLEKNQEGRIYFLNRKSEFITHKAGFSKIRGSVKPETFIEFVLDEKSLPQYFHIYDASDAIINAIQKDDRFGTKLRKRVQLRYLDNALPTIKHNINLAVTFSSINPENFDALQDFNLDLENKFWTSKQDFLQRGYGVVAWINGNPVSISYSACVANNLAEIDVTTLLEYKGKGLAKAVTIEFVKESIRKGYTANWDCFKENVASLKTAKRLKFTKLKDYAFLSIYNKTKG